MPAELTAAPSVAKVDIVVVADIRVGDVAAPCHAAATAALVAAGYRVALVPVLARGIDADPYRIDSGFADLLERGDIRRMAPDEAVECTLALAFDARIFANVIDGAPDIRSEHRLVTVERPAALAGSGRPALDRMRARAEEVLGGPALWCATSTTALDALAHAAPDWPVARDIWAPVAPDLSAVRPDAEERARPAVGQARIARTRPGGDWPERFLDSALVTLRKRGDPGMPFPGWPQPAPTECWPDDGVTLAEFFARLDMLANPDVAANDPLPVEVLMALTAGVVPCLPEEYRELFGGAAVYGPDSELLRAIIDLKMNPDLMESVRRAGRELVREVFAPGHFVSRVEALIGPPRFAAAAPAIHAASPATVLFYSTNGIGMGHLTRQLAVARRLPGRLRPAFISHSRAIDTVRGFGFPGEHLPYHATYGEARAHWGLALAEALDTAFAFYRPRVLLFDGNVPFDGLLAALDRRPDIASVWVRRGMWGAGRDLEAMERAEFFDAMVEPLDPAWPRDLGPTADHRGQVRVVPPVRILDTAELPDRATACAALGLDPKATNVLVATGAGNNYDTAAVTRRVIEHLHGRPGIGLAVAEWQIADKRLDLPGGVAQLAGFPFARSLPAFDFAVAAPGYNTFCEHLASALPTIWVPNEHAQMDRQIDRARHAVARRVGLMVRATAPFDAAAALDRMLDGDARAAMAAAGRSLAGRELAQNGAGEIAALVADLAASTLSAPSPPPEPSPEDEAAYG